ncbi:MAG: hypothetical protein ACRET1_00870, partial [Burkholderiales bacterium]
ACIMLMTKDVGEGVYNIGTGTDVTISELANCIKDVVGLDGELAFDAGKPDGMPRKLLDVARIRALGWKPRFDLEAGVRDTYRWCLDNVVFERANAEMR